MEVSAETFEFLSSGMHLGEHLINAEFIRVHRCHLPGIAGQHGLIRGDPGTTGSPLVSVHFLSKATTPTLRMRSSDSQSLTSTPTRAARSVAIAIPAD
jgi:hypothetical protein